MIFGVDIPLLLFFALSALFCKLIYAEHGKNKALDRWFLKELSKLDKRHFEMIQVGIQAILEEELPQKTGKGKPYLVLSRQICTLLFGRKGF